MNPHERVGHSENRASDADFHAALRRIVRAPSLHARWLNTLSLMENCGARKIARFEHPVRVTTIILKHAAEEFRHAFTLKRQIARLGVDGSCTDYGADALLAPRESRRYLTQLDVDVCRHLKRSLGLSGWELRFQAYLLVTWAIEQRAGALYPLYQSVLDEESAPVSVRPIIAEEEEHLAEMERMLEESAGPRWRDRTDVVRTLEDRLYHAWARALATEIARTA